MIIFFEVQFEDLGRPACRILVIFVAVLCNKVFLQDKVVSLKPNPHAWKAVGLSLVWTLLLDLSGLGGPTRSVNTPASIALGVAGMHKPLCHNKATVPCHPCYSILLSTGSFVKQRKISEDGPLLLYLLKNLTSQMI